MNLLPKFNLLIARYILLIQYKYIERDFLTIYLTKLKGSMRMQKKLKRNRIRCKHCGNIIESKSTNDFKRCKCGAVGIDGGLDYAKRVFASNQAEQDYEELSEYE